MSQKTVILKHLQSGASITQLEALNKFGCFRLADVIWHLRKQRRIDKVWIDHPNGKRFASYKLSTTPTPLELFKTSEYERASKGY